jgi:hypothetical protein
MSRGWALLGHRYLTIVTDHDTGRVVWVGKGRSQATFEEFFDALGDRADRVGECVERLDGARRGDRAVHRVVSRPPVAICSFP